MVGRTAKRSSEDIVFSDTKKKKISKEKVDGDANEKSSATGTGDLRQKKAFFAFFGKTFDDGKDSATNVIAITKTSRDTGSKTTPAVNNPKKKHVQPSSDTVFIVKYVTL